jgi:RNA polymerase sigma factor (sigma-70 family)
MRRRRDSALEPRRMKPADHVNKLAARLFHARGADLLRFLRQRLGSIADARDLAQETYLRFIRLGDPDRIDNPEAYLFRIASNLLWEHRLRAQSLLGQSPLEETATEEHTPLDLTATMQIGEKLKLALNALPPVQRAILVLHLRDGISCVDIGGQTGLSASMVKKHLRQALGFCRRRLRARCFGDLGSAAGDPTLAGTNDGAAAGDD